MYRIKMILVRYTAKDSNISGCTVHPQDIYFIWKVSMYHMKILFVQYSVCWVKIIFMRHSLIIKKKTWDLAKLKEFLCIRWTIYMCDTMCPKKECFQNIVHLHCFASIICNLWHATWEEIFLFLRRASRLGSFEEISMYYMQIFFMKYSVHHMKKNFMWYNIYNMRIIFMQHDIIGRKWTQDFEQFFEIFWEGLHITQIKILFQCDVSHQNKIVAIKHTIRKFQQMQ